MANKPLSLSKYEQLQIKRKRLDHPTNTAKYYKILPKHRKIRFEQKNHSTYEWKKNWVFYTCARNKS